MNPSEQDINHLILLRNNHIQRLGVKIINDKYILPDGSSMTWHNVVRLSKVDAAGHQFLINYGNFRKEIVDALLNHSLKSNNCDECIIQSVGSKNPVSDYDISVSGLNVAKAVEDFNRTFYTMFNETSSIVFDTNIYGTAFYQPTRQSINEETCVFILFPYKSDIDGVHHIKYVNIGEADVKIELDQKIWAFIKLLMYISPSQLEKLKGSFAKSGRLTQYLKAAEVLKAKLDKVLTGTSQSEKNKQYTKWLHNVTSAYNTLTNLDECPMPKAKRDYQNAISTANYYGSETYLTRGAFFHVVGKLQSEITELPITLNEYVNSYIENIADILKTIKSLDIERDGTTCMNLIVEISKYYYRALDAIYHVAVTLELDPSVIESVKAFRDSTKQLKNKIRGKIICDKDDKEGCIPIETSRELYMNFLNLQNLDCNDPGGEILKDFTTNLLLIYSNMPPLEEEYISSKISI